MTFLNTQDMVSTHPFPRMRSSPEKSRLCRSVNLESLIRLPSGGAASGGDDSAAGAGVGAGEGEGEGDEPEDKPPRRMGEGAGARGGG